MGERVETEKDQIQRTFLPFPCSSPSQSSEQTRACSRVKGSSHLYIQSTLQPWMEWNVGSLLKFLWPDHHNSTDLSLREMGVVELKESLVPLTVSVTKLSGTLWRGQNSKPTLQTAILLRQTPPNPNSSDEETPCFGFAAGVRSLREEQGGFVNIEEIPSPLHPQAQSNPAGARLSRTPSLIEQHIRENSESHLSLIRRLNEGTAYTENQVGPAGCYKIEADLPSSP